jgi:hypothetical protein
MKILLNTVIVVSIFFGSCVSSSNENESESITEPNIEKSDENIDIEKSKRNVCNDFIFKKYDDVTGNTTYYTENFFVLDEVTDLGFAISMASGSEGNVLIQFISAGKSKCIEGDAKAYFLFTDGTRMEYENDKDSNCEMKYIIQVIKGYEKDLISNFKNKRIQKLRIETLEGNVEAEFKYSESDKFQDLFNCFTKNF